MINIRLCFCLLSAVSFVKTFDVKGRVGEDVWFKCSDWDTWRDVKDNAKYFCNSPCTDNKHIIIKSAYGQTQHKDRIQLTNNGSGLFVKFTNLNISDSRIYYCGVDILGLDEFIKVNLTVTEIVAVSFVKTLHVKGRVGEDVWFECSDWDTWLDVKDNDKYFCNSPCTEYKHIIIKSAFGQTRHKDRIQLTNNGSGLFVKFTNLNISDSRIYYCGVDIFGWDKLIEVNLTVTEMSSSTSDVVTHVHVSQNTSYGIDTSAAQGPGSFSLIALLVSVVVVIVIVTVLLWLLRKMVQKKQKKEQTQQAVHYAEITFKDQQTMSGPAGISTPSISAGGDSVYANCVYNQSRERDVIYTKVLAPSSTRGASPGHAEGAATNLQSDPVYTEPALKKNPLYSELSQSGGDGNDGLYSLVQLPGET